MGAGTAAVMGTLMLALPGAVAARMVPPLTLSRGASAAATELVQAKGRGAGLSQVSVAADQSFRVLDRGREVATLVTGKGTVAGANPGCFAAIVQEGRVSVAPTIGSGEWEAQTCGAPVAAALLSVSSPVRIGVIFHAYSPNAEGDEPVVLVWDRARGTLTTDPAASRRASVAGATTISAMRQALR